MKIQFEIEFLYFIDMIDAARHNSKHHTPRNIFEKKKNIGIESELMI